MIIRVVGWESKLYFLREPLSAKAMVVPIFYKYGTLLSLKSFNFDSDFKEYNIWKIAGSRVTEDSITDLCALFQKICNLI
jgi:hypothetical protein